MLGWLREEIARASRSKRSLAPGFSRQVFGQNLDGDGTVEAGVAGTIHLSHAARAQRRLNFVRPEHGSRGECHSWAASIALFHLGQYGPLGRHMDTVPGGGTILGVSTVENKMGPAGKPESHPGVAHYDANYGNFQTELYAQIRREAFGEDIGQSSWTTAAEHDRFVALLDLAAGKKLLDIACGSGGPVLRTASLTGCSVVGIDIHEDAVSTGNSLAAQRGLTGRAEFRVADATTQLPFPDASFDAITCIDAINHLRAGRVY